MNNSITQTISKSLELSDLSDDISQLVKGDCVNLNEYSFFNPKGTNYVAVVETPFDGSIFTLIMMPNLNGEFIFRDTFDLKVDKNSYLYSREQQLLVVDTQYMRREYVYRRNNPNTYHILYELLKENSKSAIGLIK